MQWLTMYYIKHKLVYEYILLPAGIKTVSSTLAAISDVSEKLLKSYFLKSGSH